ncbi:uncharacterized protein Z520_00774 [Fonsecaea multimorphosa CBS 102226]|uniref:Uncharacterized protein n=1 Tax=Fonsecaea multimorphosa CBS 102226 TaxID=1442371 RepID=A0A0D2J3V5_9EURO|nr:uncharacterized protein Z520_00774 [Fonsecaea multimorphosa CBS 102226]KIY04082.1 hypothetical protein Z520_00774 [Fonsecaea multimorphosa CBS 102226]OAL31916.1 hypothetical protein AYO22_00786 [Fonsecaea multimorphosa]
MRKAPPRIVLDWDGTLTRRDTLHVVAGIGYKRNRHRGGRDLMPWDQIVQAYISDYTAHRDSYRPAKSQRTTVGQESAWLASLGEVERRSVQRVRGAGVFADVTEEDVCEAAEDAVRGGEVQLRDGWKDVLAGASRCARSETAAAEATARPPLAIISVNWSAAFIRACLSAAAALGDCPPPMKDTVDSIEILSNHLACEPSENTSGTTTSIHTSADKLEALNRLRESGNGDILYVGDSATDFDCLVAADVGICVRDEPLGSGQAELKECLERVGVEVSRLDWDKWIEYQRGGHRGPRQGKHSVVWWVADLREVASFVEKYCDLD